MKKIFTLLVLFCIAVSVNAEWRDIKVDLTNGNLLEESEKVQWGDISAFGIAVDGDGAVSRVASDSEDAACVISGKWHSNSCWASLNITVKVEGTVKISCGTQPWSANEVIIKDGSTTIASFSNSGDLWDSSHKDRIVSGYYTGGATTLTINGGGYPTYFAIETASYVPDNKTVTFSIGESGASGIAPATVVQDIKVSTALTIPANFTLYKDGYTLTGWNDGTTTYALGAAYTITDNVNFTPVFTSNAKSLSERTEAVTAVWNFRRDQGAPKVAWEGSSSGDGHLWTTQVTIGGESVDLKMDVDANPGKFNNSGNTDWIQLNSGTTLTIPAAKGMRVTFVTYNAMTTTTIAGSSTYDAPSSGSTGNYSTSYTYAGEDESVDIVIGDGQYYRTVTVEYPLTTVAATIAASGYTTFASDYALDLANLPDGLTAYQVEAANVSASKITLTQVTEAVAAGTPLVLKGTASTSYDIPVAATGSDISSTNILARGPGAAVSYEAGKTKYVLSGGKFKRIADGKPATVPTNKAYVLYTGGELSAPSLDLEFSEGEATGIDAVEKAQKADGVYYNVNGQRVAQPTKGLYIVNGRKVVIK